MEKPTVAQLWADVRQPLAEGPVWFENALWWVDIPSGTLHRREPGTGELTSQKVGSSLGVALPARDGWWWTAREHDVAWLHWASGRVVAAGSPEPPMPLEHRFNDGRCDPRGRPWVGTMVRQGEKGSGALFGGDDTGQLRVRVPGVNLSNGLAWGPDGRSFYYIDTPTRRVDRFDYNADTGAVTNRRPLAEFAPAEGMPDGMTIDQAGHLWVATWGGSSVHRLDGRTGARLQRIMVPAKQVTSCTFGGATGRTLYITTARIGLKDDDLAAQPAAGGIFTVETDTAGLPLSVCTLAPPVDREER
jgi:sugar lactone lactonase YvrE